MYWRKDALAEACEAGHQDFAVKLLRIHGVNLNAYDSYRRTPFIFACEYNLAKVVRAMVDEPKGRIDFNRRSVGGETGFYHACRYNYIEVVKIIVQNSLKLGIDLNVQDDNGGSSGVMIACFRKNHEIVDFLLANRKKYNINLKLRDKWGESAKELWPEKFSKSA